MKKTRMTNQRRKILEYLHGIKTHPTAEMVYSALRKELPSMTLATVYRNLNHLAEEGKIIKFDVKCVSHFDGDMSFHQHCICCECGKVKDVFEKDITSNTLKKIKLHDFEPQSLNIIIYGKCKKCKGG
jgi:Fe2+ or Zn2+ uptake regulation protein